MNFNNLSHWKLFEFMKHNPFYYVVCLEKYMDSLLQKNKTWTEKTFKQISNVELSFTNSNVYCINMFCLNDWNIFNSSNITNKEYKVFQTKYMYLDIMKAIKNTLYQRVSTIYSKWFYFSIIRYKRSYIKKYETCCTN